jgi:4-amino-4-deoxy-L-arabinose transferase-like glycosyltransferase
MRRSSIRDIGLPEMRLGWPVLAVPPIVVAILLLLLLAADPAAGITTSNGIRTDEAWDVINARNLVLLGHWSTDDWNLHLVNVPYSVVMAAVFSAFGVGIEQARLVSVAATAITIGALGLGLRRALGGGAALLAAIAFGGATLVLYYGRLAFLEPTVTMWLTIGGLLVLRARSDRSGRWGSGAGIAFALAIGTKPSVLFAITGLLIAVAVVGIRDAAPRRWLIGATAVIVVAAIGWTLLIGLPNREAVATDLRIWAAEPILASPATLLRTLATFLIRNDHMLLLAVPILVFAAPGTVVALRARRGLHPQVVDLAVAAVGWLVAGYGLLAVAPYRPNRYELPLLPALAILGAIGWCSLMDRRPDWRPRARVVAVGAVAVAVAAPGLLSMAGWARSATYVLPAVQSQVSAALRRGDTIEGALAPAFALDAPAITLVSRQQTSVNPGDLYATRGVRWFVGARGAKPSWAKLHPAAWSGRVELVCVEWGGPTCVWHVP